MLKRFSACESTDSLPQTSVDEVLKRCIAASSLRSPDLPELRSLRFDQPVRAVDITYKAFPGERHRLFSMAEQSIKPISVYSGCIRAGLREGDRKIARLDYRLDHETLLIEVSFKPGRPFALLRR